MKAEIGTEHEKCRGTDLFAPFTVALPLSRFWIAANFKTVASIKFWGLLRENRMYADCVPKTILFHFCRKVLVLLSTYQYVFVRKQPLHYHESGCKNEIVLLVCYNIFCSCSLYSWVLFLIKLLSKQKFFSKLAPVRKINSEKKWSRKASGLIEDYWDFRHSWD